MKLTDYTDMVGRTFGRLRVVAQAEAHHTGGRAWSCLCDCGRVSVVLGARLRSGKTKSCGCLKATAIGARRGTLRHGHAAGTDSPTYNSWRSMRKRCKPDAHCRADYFDRGVAVCERWADFEAFLADMGERPAEKTLDRFPNPDGNYEPGNCRWATKKEQAQNRKSTVWIEVSGKRKCLADWAVTYGVYPGLIRQRLALNWDPALAVSTPPPHARAGRALWAGRTGS